MYSIADTAKYILETAGSMTAMKLQKLCYYAQAWSLAWDNEPLFSEDFAAWKTGPVCEELRQMTYRKYVLSAADLPGDSAKLSADQKDTIHAVLKEYEGHTADWLNRLAQAEEPWKKANQNSHDKIILKESMLNYYSRLLSRLRTCHGP